MNYIPFLLIAIAIFVCVQATLESNNIKNASFFNSDTSRLDGRIDAIIACYCKDIRDLQKRIDVLEELLKEGRK